MSKDHLERRTYRRSPGRQYGYDYDPLRSQSGQSQGEESQHGASKSGALMSQRPNPRRTRQIMRQSIIASKRINDEETESVDFLEQEQYPQRRSSQELYDIPENDEYIEFAENTTERTPSRSGKRYSEHGASPEEYMATAPGGRRSSSRAARMDVPDLPQTSDLLPLEEAYLDDPYHTYSPNDWRTLDVDPELGIEEPHHDYIEGHGGEFDEDLIVRPSRSAALRDRQAKPTRHLTRKLEYPEEEEEFEYEYEEEQPSVRPTRKKRKISRRGLLIGAGIATVAGIGVAAYEVAPKMPAALNNATTNLEHQVQEAFTKGMEQGAEQARKEFVTALDNLEGFTLDGAIAAARLTRVAYDVFVSPVIKTGSALTGDFLTNMVKAFKTAREWLAGVYQDNATLIAIQKVLEAWAAQVSTMPKQLDAITQTDLDGAQAYLRGLKRMVEEEKSKINKPQGTPTAQTTPAASTKPTQVPKK